MSLSLDTSPLTKQMEAIRLRIETDGKRKALRAGGNVIAQAMVERAPVNALDKAGSDSLPPGAVRDSIKTRLRDDDGEMYALVGPGKKTAHVAGWVEYGHRMVHGGYSKVMPDGKTRGNGIAHKEDVPEHPFLRPAVEASRREALAEEAHVLNQVLKEK